MDTLPNLEKTLESNEQVTDTSNESSAWRVETEASLPRVPNEGFNKNIATPSSMTKDLTSQNLSPPTWARNKLFKQSRYNLRDKGTNFRSQAAQYLVAQHIFQSTHVNHIYDDNGGREKVFSLLSGKTKISGQELLAINWVE